MSILAPSIAAAILAAAVWLRWGSDLWRCAGAVTAAGAP